MCTVVKARLHQAGKVKWYGPYPPWLVLPDHASALPYRHRQRYKEVMLRLGGGGAGGALPQPPKQKYRCRVGREVTRPGPSPDPDKEISTIRLFRRCGSWLYVATTFTSSGDMLSNVSALDMVLF